MDDLRHSRGRSIPRDYHRQTGEKDKFTVTDAAQLKLKLQALDDQLSSETFPDTDKLKNACQSRPFHEEIYVPGSETFYLLVKNITRPDLIPDVYVDAYAALRRGCYPLNHYKVTDFKKGVDPTFSQVRVLLSDIDDLCGTQLNNMIRDLENDVTPFTFLRLPAELRLQVYSHLLPREAHIGIIRQPHPKHRPPRISLSVLRVNQQLHKEVANYFYEKRSLFAIAMLGTTKDAVGEGYWSSHCETLATTHPNTRLLFTRLEIQLNHFHGNILPGRRAPGLIPRDVDPLQHMLTLLPNLTILVIAFGPTLWSRKPGHEVRGLESHKVHNTLQWLLGYIPQEVTVLWDRAYAEGVLAGRNSELQELMHCRGPPRYVESVTSQIMERMEPGGMRRHTTVQQSTS